MKNKSKPLGLHLATAVIGFSSILLPHPYSNFGILLLFLGFMLLIIIGHKAAFRQHEFGIFAWWRNPGRILGADLTQKEKQLLFLGLTLVLSVILSIIVKTLFANG
jgi:hypothetical protein